MSLHPPPCYYNRFIDHSNTDSIQLQLSPIRQLSKSKWLSTSLHSLPKRPLLNHFTIRSLECLPTFEKAFLHVQLHKDDRDYSRFLWLSDPTNPKSKFHTYRFKVVLFGATCSPFMLNATRIHHLSQYNSTIYHKICLEICMSTTSSPA